MDVAEQPSLAHVRPLAGQVEQPKLERLEVQGQPAVDALPVLGLVNRVVHLVVVLDLRRRTWPVWVTADNFVGQAQFYLIYLLICHTHAHVGTEG